MKNQNPLLGRYETAFHSTPFSEVKPAHFLPALELAFTEAREKIKKITDNKEPANFANTLLALEEASESVEQVSTVFFNLLSADGNEEILALAKEISPKIAAFGNEILLDEKLFTRIKAAHDQISNEKICGEQIRLVDKTFKGFKRNGALLSASDKDRLKKIDEELANIAPRYSENVLKATNEFKMFINDPKDLAGLPDSIKEAAEDDAKEEKDQAPKAESKWLFTLKAPSYIPFITYSENRSLREKLWRAYASRAFEGSHSNKENCLRIAQLRFDRAQLLGYQTHAHFVLEERMAEKPEKVLAFLDRILDKSWAAAQKDLKDVTDLAKTLDGLTEIMPWDFAFYSEKLKKQQFQLDQEILRPYFQLNKVIEGVFEHAKRLYNLKFTETKKVSVYHEDVRVFEVTEQDSGNFVGLFYADFFPRQTKRGGAWMTAHLEQGLFWGDVQRPHVGIVCNFTKPSPQSPSLLTFEEVQTLYHEFGHALHGLLSRCTYRSVAGTNVYWDFVELPSQLMENWTLEKESLELFATHYKTGEPLPIELMEKIKESARFQAGYRSVRQLSFAYLDMAWHANDPSAITDVDQFERETLKKTQLFKKIEGTNSSVAFSHIFEGGYSAGYYSYKWAEVLDADAFEAFKERGLFDPTTATLFRENILERGGTEHPMELYKKFRGREPDPDALLRRDGLI